MQNWLNYHHLLYFWTAARLGSVSRAAEALSLAQPTISGQIRQLEAAVGEPLFARQGRRLTLTDTGRLVYRHATEIFTAGADLQAALDGRPAHAPARVAIGIADVLPKLVAFRLLRPALALADAPRLVCRQDRLDRLLAGLAAHEIDVVLADQPLPAGASVRAFTHLLGECAVTFFAAPPLARRLRRGFPRSLDGMPLLVPGEHTTLRRSLDLWTARAGIAPRIVAELDDSALMKVFGQEGVGVFAAPSAVRREVEAQYAVRAIATVRALRERFYVISPERRLQHPAIVAIYDAAGRFLHIRRT